MDSTRKSTIIQLFIVVLGTCVLMFGIVMFYQHHLTSFSLTPRFLIMLGSQWLLLLIPIVLMILNKEGLSYLGFVKERPFQQIGIGLIIAGVMSFFLTLTPILLGYKEMVGNIVYTKAWQFILEFIFLIFGVALAEEVLFRGYIFHKLLEVKDSKSFAIIISSVLFGLIHLFNGNIIQVFMTSLIGILFCVLREKIKGCTLLSLIVAHGVYDWLIVLWVSVL